ncbi:MAG: ABC exporter membrane fusion protein [Cyanobacteria bacterium P01_A01_bin.105]
MDSSVMAQKPSWWPARRWVVGLAAVGSLGIVLFGGAQLRLGPASEESVEVAAPQISSVTALGRLTPDGEIINLTAPTSVQESRIDQLLVSEGDRVDVGDVVAILDNYRRLQATLQQAEGQVEIARARLAEVRAGAQTGEVQAQQAEIARLQADQAGSVSTQRAAIARLEAEVQNAQTEYRRYESLYQRGAVSASERDSRQLADTTTRRQLQEARAALERIQSTTDNQIAQARATLNRIEEVRPVDVATAQAEVDAAIATVAEAQASLDQASVKSPVAGQILEIHTRPGETVGSEGIATLGQTRQMMVVAEVYQDDIARVEVGQSVEVTSPAIPEPLTGTVARIGLQVGQQQVVNEDPTTNIDARVIETHIRLDEASRQRVAGLTNLQVAARITTQ